MKAEKKPTRPKAARASDSDGMPLDPFAADMFAARQPGPAVPLPDDLPDLDQAPEIPRVAWHSRLASLPREQVRFSAELAELPSELVSFFWQRARGILARYTQCTESTVSAGWHDGRESTAVAFEDQTGNAPHIFAALRLEPGNLPFLLAMEASFGVSLTDRMLGGPGDAPDSLRNLSTGERAVIEFLGLQVLRELDIPAAPFALRLEQIAPTAPNWLLETGAGWGLGLSFIIRLHLGTLNGLLRVYFPTPTVRALSQPAIAAAQPSPLKELAGFAGLAPDFPLSILIGQAELNAEELLLLDLGDVVVIEQPIVEWQNHTFHNELKIRVGDGPQAFVRGLAQNETENICLQIQEIHAGKAPPPAERLDMGIPLEEEVTSTVEVLEEEIGEGAALLDAIMLTVHIELAARRVRLDELARLRINQILELGCKATDPVDLLVDGRRVARGELVDLEGRLGVRITHLT